MLIEHLNHKAQVQGLTAVSICILTWVKQQRQLKHIFVYVKFQKCMFLKTYNQSCCVHVLILHQKLSYMLTLQAFQSDKFGDCPTGLAVFAGHDGGEVRPAGVQVKGLLGSYSGS